MRAGKALFLLFSLAIACGDPTGPTVKSITIAGGNFVLSVGGTRQLTVAVIGNDDNLAGTTADWSSSNEAIATVTQTGKVTGVGEGPVTITASAGGRSTSVDFTVKSMVSDKWQGSLPVSGGAVTLLLTLSEAGGVVTGTGVLAQSLNLTVTGTYSAPNVTLTATATGFQPMTITGTVAATTMTGVVNGSGFVDQQITLTKQPGT